MSGPDAPKLDTCGCCEEDIPVTSHFNPPGQPALKYRVGKHPAFLERMKARIHAWQVPDGDLKGERPLRKLSIRSADDPAIALMDAWATVADVLTFYQERIANEGFLRTATERRSVLRLARAIGYELRPGVAAETCLAFTLQDAERAPTHAAVPAGTQVMSIPAAQGERPQTFETAEDFVARVDWNALEPRLQDSQTLTSETTRAFVKGTANNLNPGDLILLLIGDIPYPKKILCLEVDKDLGHTRIDFSETPIDPPTGWTLHTRATLDPSGDRLQLTPGHVEEHIFSRCWSEKDLQAFLTLNNWAPEVVISYIEKLRSALFENPVQQLFVLREQVGFFGASAPYYESLPDKEDAAASNSGTGPKMTAEADAAFEEISVSDLEKEKIERAVIRAMDKYWPHNWDDSGGLSIWKDAITNDYYYNPGAGSHFDVFLERLVRGLTPHTWAVIERPKNECLPFRIGDVADGARAGFGMSAKVTGLGLNRANHGVLNNNSTDKSEDFKVRTSTAHVKSEPLNPAPLPVKDDLEAGDTELWLDVMVLGLKEGQAIALSGKEAVSLGDGTESVEGRDRHEILTLKEILHSGGYTRLGFEEGLTRSYKRHTVAVNANVVSANHGETVAQEVLGSGNGAAAHQRLTLKKPPLTYVSAPTADGTETTLAIRVDGVKWTESPSLYELDKNSRGYVVRIDDAGKADVLFGDGRRGARLPTGEENVVASYRSGIGSEGEVGAGSLTLLKSRPFGVRSVTNPLQAAGSGDPEKLEDARTNAPLTVLTLDRIVSVRDYEDFARAFAGIGKALAATVWDGEAERVHITVADADGDPVVSPLYDNLLTAVERARDPLREVILASFQPLVFFVEARVVPDPDHIWEKIRHQIEQALLEAFGFSARAFAQPVTAAEVLKVIHGVKGVKAVDLDKLYHTPPEAAPPPGNLFNAVLDALPARYDKVQNKILPAQLLIIHDLGISLSEMTL